MKMENLRFRISIAPDEKAYKLIFAIMGHKPKSQISRKVSDRVWENISVGQRNVILDGIQ